MKDYHFGQWEVYWNRQYTPEQPIYEYFDSEVEAKEHVKAVLMDAYQQPWTWEGQQACPSDDMFMIIARVTHYKTASEVAAGLIEQIAKLSTELREVLESIQV